MSSVHYRPLSAVAYASGSSQINVGGQAGCGVVLYIDGERPLERQWSLGLNVGNHDAEYLAVQLALETAIKARVTDLSVYSKSELVIYQMQGFWEVRSPYLLPLYLKCHNLLRGSGIRVKWEKINTCDYSEWAHKLARGAANCR